MLQKMCKTVMSLATSFLYNSINSKTAVDTQDPAAFTLQSQNPKMGDPKAPKMGAGMTRNSPPLL